MITLEDFFNTLKGSPEITIKTITNKEIYKGSAYLYCKNYIYPEDAEVCSIEALRKNKIEIIVDFMEDFEELENEVINTIKIFENEVKR